MPLILPAASSLRTASTCCLSAGETRDEIFPYPTPPFATVKMALMLVLNFAPAAFGRLDRLVDGDVDLLRGARHHVRAEVALVGVDADAEDTALLRRREDAETALAGDLEDGTGAVGDHVQRLLLALRLVDEVLRVGVRHRHLRAGPLRARVVARDEAIDRRDLEAADGTELRLALERLRDDLLRGQEPDQVAGLLLLEEQTADVGRLALELGRDAGVVDDRELRLREPLRDLRDRVGHQEADADHEPAAVPRSAGQVRDVVTVGLRDEHRCRRRRSSSSRAGDPCSPGS